MSDLQAGIALGFGLGFMAVGFFFGYVKGSLDATCVACRLRRDPPPPTWTHTETKTTWSNGRDTDGNSDGGRDGQG